MPTQHNTPKPKKAKGKKTEATPRRPRSTRSDPTQAGPQLRAVPDEDKYMPTAWGGGDNPTGPQDLPLPSGQLVLARKPGLQQLMVEGVLHNMDNLTALVEEKHVNRVKGKPPAINVKSLLGDQEQMASVLHAVDRVVCAVVLRPHVEMSPNDITRRQAGVIYADSVDIADKMFIFNWALGGSRDIERFRRESAEVVGDLAVVESVESPAE